MNLVLFIMIAHFAASVAFAAWAIWKIRRLRGSVRLAHHDIAYIRCLQEGLDPDEVQRRIERSEWERRTFG